MQKPIKILFAAPLSRPQWLDLDRIARLLPNDKFVCDSLVEIAGYLLYFEESKHVLRDQIDAMTQGASILTDPKYLQLDGSNVLPAPLIRILYMLLGKRKAGSDNDSGIRTRRPRFLRKLRINLRLCKRKLPKFLLFFIWLIVTIAFLPLRLFFYLRGVLFEFHYYLILSYCQRKLYHAFFTQHKPDVLVISEEIAGLTHKLTREAKRCGITVIAAPYTLWGPTEPAYSFSNDSTRQVKGVFRRLLSIVFPKWTFKYKGKKIFYLTPPQILAEEITGKTPPRPWYPESGWADVVAVESNRLKDFLIKQRVEEERVTIIGSAALDELYCPKEELEHKRKKIRNEFSLKEGRRLVYCAIPPEILDTTCALFPSDELILKNVVYPLLDLKNCDVIFGLHPKDMNRKSPVLEHIKGKLHRGNITEFLPAMDGFVACISATIRWAIALGIPTVNFDIFGMHYDDYISVSSVKTVYTMESYKEYVMQLDDNVQYYQWYSQAIENRADWGLVDGQFGNRFCELVKSLDTGHSRSLFRQS